MVDAHAAGLFENQREINLASTVTMIEDVLIELGHFVNDCREELPDAVRSWRIRKGSATVRISLLDRDDFTHVRVASAVLTLDPGVDRAALFGHLLALNAELCGAAFAVRGDVAMVVTERSTLDLDRSEVMELIDRVTSYADDHDDVLVSRFGGSQGGDLPR
jgi:hypothetical protein